MRASAFCLALATLAVSCGLEHMPDAREGEALFSEHCAACHGSAAEGGELSGGQYAPDLTGIAARNDGVFPTAQVLSRVDGFGRGHNRPDVMPEFGALLNEPLVPFEVDGSLTPTPRALVALATYLESIQVLPD